ncbi:MAG TPA: hypothetical protein VI934_00960 [Candidatus Nanoarchaeia archaeon]|nr:hypothetical protein [Candidatus Nanoarchaeia archaeon]
MVTCHMCEGANLEMFLDLGMQLHSDGFLTAEELQQPEVFYPLSVYPALIAHAYKALEDSVFLAITTKRRDKGGYDDDTFKIELVK